jgi:hypothetical protein
VPNLLQYVTSGVYFGKVKIEGKVFRSSLKTDVFTTAKLRLADFIQEKHRRQRAQQAIAGTFAEARLQYLADLQKDYTVGDGSRKLRRGCINALLRTWPELDTLSPAKITEAACKAWASRFAGRYDEQFFNNTLSTLRLILERAGLG